MNAILAALALAADAIIGDPEALWRRIPHPVAVFGWAIAQLDRRFNRPGDDERQRRTAGALCLAALVSASLVVGALVQATLVFLPFGYVVLVLIASVFIAQRSLYLHVEAVRSALVNEGLQAARRAVSAIVGRDPESLDEAGVARAAIESTAENFSDGVVAPALWFALLGLPGLVAYKAINTADSMIGHLTPRHAAFGWASARLDDLVNWPAARLSVLFISAGAALTGGRADESLRAPLRDAPKHRSPNAGWPEAAFAGALGLALAGPRRYGGRVVADAYMNTDGRHEAGAEDIGRALRLFRAACAVQVGFYLVVGVLVW